MVQALILAAPSSGSGKTVLTLALLRCLRKCEIKAGSFKVGPDYIDPGFHEAAGGRACYNLDGWAMRPATLAAVAGRAASGVEMLVGEGVMGLFDGAADGNGSTAHVAAMTGIPVVLIVDVRGQAASAAAVVQGFAGYRDDVAVAGVIFNRVGGPAHRQSLRRAADTLDIPLLGLVPRCEELTLPARHLGLVQARENDGLENFLETSARIFADYVDVEGLMDLAREPMIGEAAGAPPIPPLGQRIAVAEDQAFSFTYASLMESWREAGAEIVPFSPLADEAPHGDADAIFLPGGYPELHAGHLAGNGSFMAGLANADRRDALIYGECGGYMVLGQGLVDGDGHRHAMAGLLPLETSFVDPRLHLGYRIAELVAGTTFGNITRFRGHEFHYASAMDEPPEAPLFNCQDALGNVLGTMGCRQGRTMGSFLHLIDAA